MLLKNLNALCLVIEDRLPHYREYIEPECAARGIEVYPFVVRTVDGPGALPDYDWEDKRECPPILPGSTTYATWRNSHRAYQAHLCHKEMIRHAAGAGWKQVLLLEDDIVFETDYEEIAGAVEDFNDRNFWHMLYLGSYLQNSPYRDNIIEPHIAELGRNSRVAGFHAVILDKSVYQAILDLPPLGPLDEMCARYIHDCNNFAVVPPIISQRSGFSSIEQSNLEKPERYTP